MQYICRKSGGLYIALDAGYVFFSEWTLKIQKKREM